MKRALIVQGGWQGHQPAQVADILGGVLRQHDFEVEIADTLDACRDDAKLLALDLIVPIWTMGTIEQEQLRPILHAVREGVGIAGCHGGMADSFRNETEYQFMVGGQWVAHPGNDGVDHDIRILNDAPNNLLKGIADFRVSTEQYYMHVDPAIRVLAVTPFADVQMPVVWTKHYGLGKVFYCSLGHQANIVALPEVTEIMRRGMLWAADKVTA
jgi:type 1 glutamine amidotransferase